MPYADLKKRQETIRASMAKSRAQAKKTRENSNSCHDIRARAWTFIVYPESAPEGWREILNNQQLCWVCSPLHDKDVNATGEPKKPHWHILLSFSGKKGYRQIWSVSEAIKGTRPQVCHEQKALIRYFTHRDNPEKAQYKSSDIEAYGGFDLEEYLKPTASECMAIQNEMIEWCYRYNVMEFRTLQIYALRERPDWANELNRSCFQITQFLKSQRYGEKVKVCNPETGEIYE